jgi:hypothetical protein
MSDTITLGDLDTELVFEAAIDGANARHVVARRYALINRCYKRLRSLVSHNGEDFFRVPGVATNTPARAAGEDWIELDWPTAASEIIGVDIQHGGDWRDLGRGSWAARRIFPGARAGLVGEWSVLSQPQPSTTTVTAGKIAIWPHNLTGQHKIHYLPHWVDITNTSHVFVLFPNWLEWLLTAATMVLIQRDNNKRDTFLAAKDRNDAAHAQILAHARRSKRGSVVARRRDGMEL